MKNSEDISAFLSSRIVKAFRDNPDLTDRNAAERFGVTRRQANHARRRAGINRTLNWCAGFGSALADVHLP